MKNAHHNSKLILDIGNSQTKYHLITNNYFTLYSLDELKERVLGLDNIDLYVVSTVPDKSANVVAETVSSLKTFVTINNIFDNVCYQILGSYLGLGVDRITKLCGALTLYPNYSVILFDFGTATTMSIGRDEPKEFLGGFIASGFKTSLKALGDYCSALPDCSESDLIAVLDQRETINLDSTEKQIVYGAYQAHLGLIKNWQAQAKEILNNIDKPVTCIATGGQAKLFSNLFDQTVESSVLFNAFFDQYAQSKNNYAN